MEKRLHRTIVYTGLFVALVSLGLGFGLSRAMAASEPEPKPEAKETVAKRDPIETLAFALGAALVTGVACVAAGMAVGKVGAAALGAVSERPELLGRTLIFVGLAEGIAIYGLIVAILLMGYLK
jgi:V/A-type H+/Na+-transporting ATPase subunit K